MRRAMRHFAVLVVALTIGRPSIGEVLPTGVTERRMATEILWNGFERLSTKARPRVILVLGGGGARGLAHIGVLRVLKEERIPVDEIVGVSVGALIGSLHAAGIAPDKIETMAAEIGWNKLTDYSKFTMIKLILSDELLSTNAMQTYLSHQIGEKSFSDLAIPFSCVATDIRTGERIVFREGPVAIAARASATIPAVFKPVEYRQRMLVDGGLVDNLPTDVIESKSDWDVVLAVLPRAETVASDSTSVFKSLVRSIEIQRDALIETNRKQADFLIEPNVGNTGIADLNRSRDCIEAGVIAARESAPALKAMLLSRYWAKQKPSLGAR